MCAYVFVVLPFSRFRGSRAEPIRVFPRLARCTCFPTLSISLMFSRAWHPVDVFPRLAAGSCFPALTNKHLLS